MKIEIKFIREPKINISGDYQKGVKDALEVVKKLHKERKTKCREEYAKENFTDAKWWDTQCCGFLDVEYKIEELIKIEEFK